jgi:iron complex transport system ATP-binding protein
MTSNEQTLLSAHALSVSVPGRQLIDELTFDLRGGEFLAILGQNGVGKSLCLLTLAGLRTPAAGTARCNGQVVSEVPRHRLARLLALLPQDTDDIFPASVMDTVMIGRHPHIGRLNWESVHDAEVATACLAQMHLEMLADRDVATLSGGERRRLAVAQILTQAPQVYLLDEPTNHLDPLHQLEVLQVFRQLAGNGALVVASLHDVNLAVRHADRCLLLYGDGRWEIGATAAILTEERLSTLYATPVHAIPWRDTTLFVATAGR